ncbi:hypothetical protein BACCIP111883_03953 [Sutcliffiella rhizosphaerae]|uniref:Uncharacterized protein n=1 Tax=Sutcliffiella rhizosphaerae TaxID=2880967 RepID=A0ABN8AHF6_9BACI|nr:hypothetical protein BACCIP111883_03953 [Sutcliffiella rhizosphaerae]
MRTLAAINLEYELIINGVAREPFKCRKLADLMDEMERE